VAATGPRWLSGRPAPVTRPRATSAAGSALLLGAGVAWVVVVVPPALPAVVAWFAALALAGLWLPGLANQVTLSRAYLAAPALVYALTAGTLLALVGVVLLAALTDLVDGAVARRLDRPTRLGGALDPVVDGVFFGALAVGLALGEAYPGWLAVLVVARYGVPALVGAVLLLLGRRPKLQHTPLGQVSTTLIAVLLGGVALLRGLGQPTGLLVEVTAVVVPLAVLGTFLNLYWANRAAFDWR
jgi:cardiolipin synthase